MKKFLRFLLILILLATATVVIAALIAPKETNITSSTVINAPKEAVWEQMVKFKQWPNWSPWHKMDPQQKLTYAGVDGEAGSSYSWIGEETGEGSMTNKAVENGKMTYELKFIKPFEAVADGYLMVEDAGDGNTKATWTYHGNNDNFLMRGMGYLMGMNKMLQKQFDEGLANMKAHVEAHKGDVSAAPAVNVQEAQYSGNTYAGIRKTIKWEDMEKTMPGLYEAVGKAAGNRISGPAIAIYHSWDTTKHEADVYSGFPISDDKPVAGATIVKIPASKAYMVNFKGNYDQLEQIHYKIGAHAESNKADVAYVLEEYIKMAPEEKDMNKWETNVYYILK